MSVRLRSGGLPALAGIILLAGCGRDETGGAHERRASGALVEVGPGEAAGRPDVGQAIYVPAYSSILVHDRAREFRLSVMLSLRNTDRDHPIIIETVRYHDQDGRLVRDFLKKPVRIGPLASMEFFIPESDTSGGVSASFLVEWTASDAVNEPLAESVMTGTASNQGIAFTCPGRVLADRSRPSPKSGTTAGSP